MTDLQPQPQSLSFDSTDGYELLRESLVDFMRALLHLPKICTTPQEQQHLIKVIAEGEKLTNLVETERLKITRILDAQKKGWIDKQRELTDPVERALAPYKSAVHAYNVERVRQIREAEELQRQAEAKLIEQNGQADWLQAKTRPEHNPRGVQMRWSFEVVDLAMVPLEYLQTNDKLVRDAISKGVRTIDGIRIYQEPVSTFRA